MATTIDELRVVIGVTNETAAGLAAVRNSVRGAIAGIDTRLGGLSERFAGYGARFAAITAPVAHLRSTIGELGETSGLIRVGEQARELGEHFRRAHEAATDLLRPLGALTAFATIGGVVEAIKSSAERGEHLTLASKATGLEVPALGGFEYAAKIANIDQERAVRAIEYLNRNRGDVAAGRGSKDLKEVLGGLNIAPGMSTAAAMATIEDKLKHLLDAHQVEAASRIAGTLFGQRSGVALLPFLGQGSEHVNKLAGEAALYGQAPTKEWAENAANFEENFKKMDSAVTGLGMSISGALFPILTPLLTDMTKWVDENREWIATNLSAGVRSVADALRSIDWSGVGSGLKEIGAVVKWVVGEVGGIGHALEAVAVIKFRGTILAFGELGIAVAATAAKLVLFPVAEFIASAATLVPTLTGIRDAFAALDLVVAANPLGAAIVAAAALAAGAYELYEHWGGVAAFFKKLWDDVVGAFQAALGFIQPVIDKIKAGLSFIAPVVGEINAAAGAAVGWMGGGEPGARQVHHPALADTPLPLGGGPRATTVENKSTAKVSIDFKNLPPGVRPQVEKQGAPFDLDLGYAWGTP